MIFQKTFILFIKGMAMGISDLVPGISGGTIALLLGVYEKFITSLKSINKKTIFYLFNFQFFEISKQLNFQFLFPLVLGILSSIFLFSSLISYLIKNYEILIFTFFFGLIFFSSLRIISNLKPSSFYDFLSIIIGFLVGSLLLFLNSLNLSDSLFSTFISGFFAISAMLLPGISGSYILVILDKYQFMLDSISSFNIPNLSIFSLGAIFGILSFSRLIYWILNNYYKISVLFLSGLMLGALIKVWPWRIDQQLVFPFGEYYELILSGLFFIISGILSIYFKSK